VDSICTGEFDTKSLQFAHTMYLYCMTLETYSDSFPIPHDPFVIPFCMVLSMVCGIWTLLTWWTISIVYRPSETLTRHVSKTESVPFFRLASCRTKSSYIINSVHCVQHGLEAVQHISKTVWKLWICRCHRTTDSRSTSLVTLDIFLSLNTSTCSSAWTFLVVRTLLVTGLIVASDVFCVSNVQWYMHCRIF
jgi:hypothetical protein